mmetsp:Transcript_38539/g.61751  ORF Transcript_38539/g.61751 Transcript_38539/m.61751 type:complete len:80 (+) Transcript_38539:287-526(+)
MHYPSSMHVRDGGGKRANHGVRGVGFGEPQAAGRGFDAAVEKVEDVATPSELEHEEDVADVIREPTEKADDVRMSEAGM